MAAVDSLGDFFSKKKTKKIKAVNLNSAANIPTPKDPEASPEKPKKKEEKKTDDWDEKEEDVVQTKSLVGNIEHKKEEKEKKTTPAKAWGKVPDGPQPGSVGYKNMSSTHIRISDTKKFPGLQAASQKAPLASQREEKLLVVNKKKNVFADLADDSGDENKGPRQGLAKKKQGETDMVTFNEATRLDVPLTKEEESAKAAKKQKLEEKKEKKLELRAQRELDEPSEQMEDEEIPEDCLIPMDMDAAAKKFEGKRKLPVAEIRPSEKKAEAVAKAPGKRKFNVKKEVEDAKAKNKVIVEDLDEW